MASWIYQIFESSPAIATQLQQFAVCSRGAPAECRRRWPPRSTVQLRPILRSDSMAEVAPPGPPEEREHKERAQAFLSTDEDQHNELAAVDVDDELVEEPTSPEKISLRVPQSLDCGNDGVDKSSSLMALIGMIGNKRGIIGNKDGATIALINAVKRGRTPEVSLLLEGKVNPNAATRNGTTPIMEAARQGNQCVLRMLLDNDGIEIDATRPEDELYRMHSLPPGAHQGRPRLRHGAGEAPDARRGRRPGATGAAT